MALNGNAIGKTVADLIIAAAPPAGTAITTENLESLWQSIMTAIYTDIKASAVVAVASVSGVTTGPSASGPGLGTIS